MKSFLKFLPLFLVYVLLIGCGKSGPSSIEFNSLSSNYESQIPVSRHKMGAASNSKNLSCYYGGYFYSGGEDNDINQTKARSEIQNDNTSPQYKCTLQGWVEIPQANKDLNKNISGCKATINNDSTESSSGYIVQNGAMRANQKTGMNEVCESEKWINVDLLIYHGGNILLNPTTRVIFWGSEWSNSKFTGDKIAGIDSFFSGFSGSAYSRTVSEYYDVDTIKDHNSDSAMGSRSTYTGYQIDSSQAPTPISPSGPETSVIFDEVCKITHNNPDPNTIYFVYTSTASGSSKYCAWHDYSKCSNGKIFYVVYVPNVDNGGCYQPDFRSGAPTGGHSKGLAAIASLTAHEFLETVTDPQNDAWIDINGNENADKCAWIYPATPGGLSQFPNGTSWRLQMEWSNTAYLKGMGQANIAGQKGCIF
ncbi:MAG: hypothetical protein ACXVCY_13665 [Pseudobdellovibrionaceae bacterium]